MQLSLSSDHGKEHFSPSMRHSRTGRCLLNLNKGIDMQYSFVRWVLSIFAIMLSVEGGWVAGAAAQEETSSSAAMIHSSNTDVVFEKAGMSGLPSASYQAFDQFVSEHPEVANALARNPRLIEDDSFVNGHPALADFLRTHSDVARDFAENPGNYVDMPVVVAASIKKHPIEPQ
jgi:hypothetical protein